MNIDTGSVGDVKKSIYIRVKHQQKILQEMPKDHLMRQTFDENASRVVITAGVLTRPTEVVKLSVWSGEFYETVMAIMAEYQVLPFATSDGRAVRELSPSEQAAVAEQIVSSGQTETTSQTPTVNFIIRLDYEVYKRVSEKARVKEIPWTPSRRIYQDEIEAVMVSFGDYAKAHDLVKTLAMVLSLTYSDPIEAREALKGLTITPVRHVP